MPHTPIRYDLFYHCSIVVHGPMMGTQDWTICWSYSKGLIKYKYCQISDISCILLENKIIDHSDVVGAAPTGDIKDLTPGFNGLDKDNCKMRRETFQILDLVHLILEILRYVLYHDDAMTWVCFLHYIASQKGKVVWNLDDFFFVRLNMLLKKQLICQWFEMPCAHMMSLKWKQK